MPTSAVVDSIIPSYTVKSYHTAAEIVWPSNVFYICTAGNVILVYSLATSNLLFPWVIDLKDVNELLHLCIL